MLVAGGHGRRIAPVARARCCAPRLNRFVLSSKIVVCGTPQAASRAHSSWGRARGRRRSALGSRPSALPCPGSQLIVFSTARRHLDVMTPAHAEASSAQHSHGDGRGEDDAWRRGLARRRVRRRRERTSHLYGCPSALPAPRDSTGSSSTAKSLCASTPQAHDAASPARRSR